MGSEPNNAEIVPVTAEAAAVPVVADTTPAGLLALAVRQDLDLEKLKGLMDLQREWQKEEARRAFYEAMAAFQAETPPLTKDSTVDFQTSKGHTSYRHASLPMIAQTIREPLWRNGLSYRFEIAPPTEGGKGLVVTCIVTHKQGHSERTTMGAGPDESGSKNPIQALGSTVTYMQRYTLIAALGLTTSDEDLDGRPTRTGPARYEDQPRPAPPIPDDWPPPSQVGKEAAPQPRGGDDALFDDPGADGDAGDAGDGPKPSVGNRFDAALGELIEGAGGIGTINRMQPQEEWWLEDRPETGFDPNLKGAHWMKIITLKGYTEKNPRTGKVYDIVCVTTSNPEKGGWGENSRITYGVKAVRAWMKLRIRGKVTDKERPVTVLETVRLAGDEDGGVPSDAEQHAEALGL